MRFVHTADWQIGMSRRYLSAEAQPRFAQARTDVVRRIGEVAGREGADFVLVCGDVFEHDQLTPQTLRRALEALRSVPVPVYLLPGNHDHLGPVSVWASPVLRDELPEHVRVLDRPGIHEVAPGVELVAVPWTGKHPGRDLVTEVLEGVPAGPAPAGTVRVLVAHGGTDSLDPDGHNPAAIATSPLHVAIDEGRLHYVALGDRHSVHQVGGAAIWYPGAPEPTDWREERPGEVLVVEVDPDVDHAVDGESGAKPVRVRPVRVAAWRYVRLDERVDSDEDLTALDRTLSALADKDRTVLRLGLRGTLGLAQHARLEELLERHADLLAALHRPAQHDDLVLQGEDDLADLGLGGFLASAVGDIQGLARTTEGEAVDPAPTSFRPDLPADGRTATDALALLYRLAARGSR